VITAEASPEKNAEQAVTASASQPTVTLPTSVER